MKKNVLLAFAVFTASFAFSQKLEENQALGTVTLKDGTVLNGVIEFDSEPYRAQNSVRYFDKSFIGKDIKNKDKQKFSPADVKEIRTEKKSYDVKRYADMSAVSFSSLGKPTFLEVVKSGKLSLYNYYAEIGVKPDLVVGKAGEEKAKAVGSTPLKPFIEDCPAVKEKFEKGEYGNNPAHDTAMQNDNLSFINKIVEDYNGSCGGK